MWDDMSDSDCWQRGKSWADFMQMSSDPPPDSVIEWERQE